jgi:NAD(P)-dependent dehydrogenase (short-subunit alcohol dehydrogenase family)
MLDTEPDLFDAHIAVNLKSPFFIMADTIRHLRERGAPGGIAHRWDKIRINGLDIGWTATDSETRVQQSAHGADEDWLTAADASVPMGRISRPAELADMVIFLLSDRSGVVTGSVIDWDQRVIGGMD